MPPWFLFLWDRTGRVIGNEVGVAIRGQPGKPHIVPTDPTAIGTIVLAIGMDVRRDGDCRGIRGD